MSTAAAAAAAAAPTFNLPSFAQLRGNFNLEAFRLIRPGIKVKLKSSDIKKESMNNLGGCGWELGDPYNFTFVFFLSRQSHLNWKSKQQNGKHEMCKL